MKEWTARATWEQWPESADGGGGRRMEVCIPREVAISSGGWLDSLRSSRRGVGRSHRLSHMSLAPPRIPVPRIPPEYPRLSLNLLLQSVTLFLTEIGLIVSGVHRRGIP